MTDDPRDRAPVWVQLALQGLIVVSIVLMCAETIPELRRYSRAFSIANTVIVILFTIEYVTFLLLSRNKLRYMVLPYSIIDLLAILPFYLQLGINLKALRALRLLRIFRILKLSRYSNSFKTLVEAFRRAGPELVSVAFVVCIIILISAMALYYAEHEAQPDVYRSIPETIWWAVVTLTTVGYGDVYPVTTAGRVIAGLIMLVGIGIIAVPAGILSSTMTEILAERRKGASDSTSNRPSD